MTKAELVAAMSKASGSTKAAAERALEAFLASVRDSMRRRKRVTLVGFGTFSVIRRAARTARNPRNGAVIRIPAMRVPRFKPSRTLKTALR